MGYSIFISYRREDSSAAVSSLLKYLQETFGKNTVFADNASISPGDQWPDEISNALSEAKIVIVLIGSNWLCREKNYPNQFRICNEEDWVRREIETAQNLNKIIIPLLVDGTEIPDHPNLPDSIKSLRNKQFRKINFQPGDNDAVEAFTGFLYKKLQELNSPDSLKVSVENILAKKYKINKIIGTGNKAKIYLGSDIGIERKIAIKVIANPDFNDDFVETLKEAASIDDSIPNYISILGAYVDKDPYHVILTFLKKGSLRKLLNEQQGRPLPYIDVKKILLDIGTALKQTHSIKKTHCNVKPSNIILNDQDDAYLNPMSLISKLSVEQILKRLSDNSVVHDETVYREELCYLAPEIFDKNPGKGPLNEVNMKIDQYMLGLLGYELLTGYIPDTLSDIDTLKQNGATAFKTLLPITDIRKDCPNKFSKIIHRMINHDPAKRYNSLEKAIDELNQVSFDVFEIVKDSYARCMSYADSGNKFFQTFYQRLVKKLPEDQALKLKTKGIGEEELNRQYSILRESIFILILFGENNLEENEPNILTRIAEMHNKNNYNIPSESYNLFMEALADTVCGLPSDSTEPFDNQCKISQDEREIIRNAWKEALKPGIEYMKSKFSPPMEV